MKHAIAIASLLVILAFITSTIIQAQAELFSVSCTFKAGGTIGYPSAPAIGDIDGDGKNEIIFGIRGGFVYAINGEDCSKLWDFKTEYPVFTAPALGDLDGDGELEVVFGATDSFAYALRGKTGQLFWKFETGGRIDSSPTIEDIDEDGKPEVIIGSADNLVYALRGENGKELWHFETNWDIISKPAVGDVDGDGKPEVAFGSFDSFVYVLQARNGKLRCHFPTQAEVFGSAALGDLDGDSKLDVVIGSTDGSIYAFKGENCSRLWAFETEDSIISSPALGDIDGDGKLEVVIGSNDSFVYALNGESGSLLWKFETGAEVVASPVLATQIDNDEGFEVVIGSLDWTIYALNGEDGKKLASFETKDEIRASPALGDVNGDGVLDVVNGSADQTLYVLKALGEVAVNSGWPNGRGNNQNTANFSAISAAALCPGVELQANSFLPDQPITAGPNVLTDPKAQYCIKVPVEAQLLAVKLDSQTEKGNVDMYIRINSPVKLSGKTVIADHALVSDGNEFLIIFKPRSGTYFMAIANPTDSAQRFTVIATPVADIQALKAGEPMPGSVDPNAGLIPFLRQYLATRSGMLGLAQYKFDVPSGAKSVTVRLEGPADKNLNMHLRYNKPVEIVEDRVAADLTVIGPGGQKGVVLAGALLKAGRWFIAVESLQSDKVDFKVIVEIEVGTQRIVTVLEREPKGGSSR